MNHTITPWRVGDAGLTVFGPPNGHPAPEVIAPCKKRANAAHIVRCVNSHAALVTLLDEMVDAIEQGLDWYTEARKALALAKVQP